jgi:hypothetical protein
MILPMSERKDRRDEIALRPNRGERIERVIDTALKCGPKHPPAPKAKERPASKGRVRKGKSRA